MDDHFDLHEERERYLKSQNAQCAIVEYHRSQSLHVRCSKLWPLLILQPLSLGAQGTRTHFFHVHSDDNTQSMRQPLHSNLLFCIRDVCSMQNDPQHEFLDICLHSRRAFRKVLRLTEIPRCISVRDIRGWNNISKKGNQFLQQGRYKGSNRMCLY